MSIIGFVLLLIILIIVYNYLKEDKPSIDGFSIEDEKIASELLEKLDDFLDSVEDISDDQFKIIQDKILLSKTPDVEKYSFNRSYWPSNYYYNLQAQPTGNFPYNMYNRLRNWSPGYYTGSGWRYGLRPGISNYYQPRNRWIRHTPFGGEGPSYYYITNLEDTKRGIPYNR